MKNKLVYLGLCLSLVACSGSSPSSKNSSPKVPSVSNSTTINAVIVGPNSIGVGDLVVYSLDKEVAGVKWQSSDNKTIEINSRGEAIAWKEGTVTLTAIDANNKVINTIIVTVENKVSYPTNEMELHSFLNKAKELEKEGSDFIFTKNSTSIEQHYTKTIKMYTDFYVATIDDEYTNHTGYHHVQSTDFYGIKDGYFYDVSDSNEVSYGIKRKIVSSNPTEYEILESQALERVEDPNCISSFMNYFGEIWGARMLGLNIEVDEKENSFILNLTNTYLFVWADGVSNDSRYYEGTLEFSNDGFLLNGNLTVTTYEEHQYIVSENKWVDNPKVKNSDEYSFSATRGPKHNVADNIFVPEDYFVSSVTKANYNKSLLVGDRILVDNIVLEDYQGYKSLDINNIVIERIQNEGDTVSIIEDTTTGGYICVSAGTAYLVCSMMYSPDVIFLVEVEVMEG